MSNDNDPTSDAPDEDLLKAAESLTEADLRDRSQLLDEAQTTWEEVKYLAIPKMPCPECSGAGSVSGGSLGDICVKCWGTRVLEVPGAQPFPMPDFAALRAGITKYGNAQLAAGFTFDQRRALPEGHPMKDPTLPPASAVPTIAQIQALMDQAHEISRKALAQGSPGIIDPKLLRDPSPAKGMLGEGNLDEYTDAELDGIEKSDADDD
jgi:hypothetical protein